MWDLKIIESLKVRRDDFIVAIIVGQKNVMITGRYRYV